MGIYDAFFDDGREPIVIDLNTHASLGNPSVVSLRSTEETARPRSNDLTSDIVCR